MRAEQEDKGYRFGDLIRDLREDLGSGGKQNLVGILMRFFFGSQFQLMCLYRFSHWVAQGRAAFLCAPCTWLQRLLTGSEIDAGARLGRGVRLPHPTGIVIGAGVVVEDEVRIFQQVTLGSHGRQGLEKGYPVIRRGACLYAGARVIGPVTVGIGAQVGANAVVTRNVPDGAKVVAVPPETFGGGQCLDA